MGLRCWWAGLGGGVGFAGRVAVGVGVAEGVASGRFVCHWKVALVPHGVVDCRVVARLGLRRASKYAAVLCRFSRVLWYNNTMKTHAKQSIELDHLNLGAVKTEVSICSITACKHKTNSNCWGESGGTGAFGDCSV
ncbi:MAG: hypothetical protein IPP22_08620 [Nitrosomonas sp.]|nr:hypothetical protein [Nitrosomonas sp.]